MIRQIPPTPFLLLVVICAFFQGCYHYRVSTTKSDPSTTYVTKTAHAFLWGLVQKRENAVDVVAANCDSIGVNKLDEVRVTTNFGYSLITVATLGIWSPVTIQWKCAKPCAREGEIR